MYKHLLIVLSLLITTGCQAEPADQAGRLKLAASGQLFVGQPNISPNFFRRVPLVAIVDVEATTDVRATLLIDDGSRQWEQAWPAAAASQHRIAVMGMKPDREHVIRVRLDVPDQGISQVSEPLSFTTPPLPPGFPPLEVVRSEPKLMEPGLTLFAANIWRNSVSILDYGFIVALDELGEVVWFCNVGDRIADMRILSNGHILYQHGNYRYAYEIDILGRDINRYVATNLTELPDEESIPVEIDTTHHDLLELPNGNLMTLATELHLVDEYPTSEFDSDAPLAPAHVVSDAVVEIDSKTGEVLKRLALRDLLDPKRIGYISLGSFWKDKYNESIGDYSRDWSHSNALRFLPEENAILVSFRHLDCIYKIDWETKEILWILGNHDDWGEPWQKYLIKPKGEWEWFYHQHAPQFTPQGTLILYDNGNYRARPYDEATHAPENRSRVLEMRIDEEAMTVEKVFEYDGGDEDRFYCPFYCEADWLPKTNNILVTDGGHIELADGTPNDNVPSERQWARIFEITRDATPRKVFEVRLDSGLDSNIGWSIYRSIHIPDLVTPFHIKPMAEGEEYRRFSRGQHMKRR